MTIFLLCSVAGGKGESSVPALSRFSMQSKGAAVGSHFPPVKTHNLRIVSATPLGGTCRSTERADVCVPCLCKIHAGSDRKRKG